MRVRCLLAFAAPIILVAAAAAAPPAFPAGTGQGVAVTVKEVEPFPYCAVSHQGPFTDIQTVIPQLIGAMEAQGLSPLIRGPLVGVYYNSPAEVAPQDLLWEVGFVITAQAMPQLPLVKKVWEHKTVAVAVHVGPYDRTGETLVKVMAWLAANGYEVTGPVLERYLDMDPLAAKPEDLRSEIWVPCRKK